MNNKRSENIALAGSALLNIALFVLPLALSALRGKPLFGPWRFILFGLEGALVVARMLDGRINQR